MQWTDAVSALSWALMAGFLALTIVEAARYFRTAMFPQRWPNATLREEATAGPTDPGAPWPRLAGMLAAGWLLSRLFILLILAAVQLIVDGDFVFFDDNLAWFLRRWDAKHYLALIQDGYVTEGDNRLLLVFLPLYPMLCRGLHLATGLSARATALLVSNLCLLGCGAAAYRLALPSGARTARRTVLLLFFCPVTFFYSMPYSESLFLLLLLLSALSARRRRWIPAMLFGALAANTRLLGMVTAIPIFWTMLRDSRQNPRRPLPVDILRCFAAALPVSAGLLAYLALNQRLFGDPLQFLSFQSAQWNQSAGSLAWTFRISFINLMTYEKLLYRLGVWGPQVLLLPAVPLLILWRRRYEVPPDTAVALVYHYVSYMPTWLLSGARYTSALYALWPMIARIPRTRRGFAWLFAGECALLTYMTVVGVWFGHVM